MEIILIPFDNDSIQDGTKRIPCLKNCGRNFATYDAAMQHVKKCDAPDTPRHCPWPDCNYPPSKAREYAAHTVVHIDDARGKYQCDKCPRYWNDLYLLAGHRMRCKGEGGKSRADRENRFQSIHDPAETDEGLTFLVAVARASGAAPKAWKGDEDPVQDGIDTFASPIFDTFQTDHGVAQGSVCGTFLAMDNIHTSVTPTAKDVMLHNIADPVLRQYITQAYVFTRAIDKDLEALASRNVKPVLLSIGIDGFSCNTKLILPWLQRSPRFTLVIRETDLPYGMDEAYFPQYESGFYYGIFDSAEILEQLSVDMSADMSGDNAISNLLAAWNALQAWKDTSPVRSRGRNGQPNEFGSKKKQRVRERE
ncbi:hypothetical protein J4E80_006872 [Alternaria sp. BMP 0032]|nr:hypothetical protein J4E80_006872 [Alternaria sp. BMP 0032]